jgi:rare lipoprotein A
MTTRFQAWMLVAMISLLAGCATRLPTSLPDLQDWPAAPGPALPPASGASPPSAPTDMPDTLAADQSLPDSREFRQIERGQASWYGPRFHGRRTANGERYDQFAMTAAHKTLPFGSLVRVRSLVTGKEIDVRINDRGPFVRGRVIDISRAGAEALGMIGLGVKDVLLLVPEGTASLARLATPIEKRPRARYAVPLPESGALRN